MTDEPNRPLGLSIDEWQAMFRPGMHEFAASRFAFSREDKDQVRIAFGNHGPADAHGNRNTPVFTHAVTLTPDLAVELARQLLKLYAEPASSRSTSSGEL